MHDLREVAAILKAFSSRGVFLGEEARNLSSLLSVFSSHFFQNLRADKLSIITGSIESGLYYYGFTRLRLKHLILHIIHGRKSLVSSLNRSRDLFSLCILNCMPEFTVCAAMARNHGIIEFLHCVRYPDTMFIKLMR
jgi:hypothetical protein